MTSAPPGSRDATSVEIRELSLTYQGLAGTVDAIAGLDASVAPGERIAIVGPSGCGKSTLLRLVAGLITPTAGQVTLDDEPAREGLEGLGIVFQEAVLLPWRTVLENVLIGPELKGWGLEEYRGRAAELLDVVGLNGFHDAYPDELSGGMQQRTALARALILEPRLLLMDEPFGALDALTRERLRLELVALLVARSMTMLFVTHDIEEAVLLGDRVLVLSDRPAHLEAVVVPDLAWPRTRDSVYTEAFKAAETDLRRLLGL